MTVQEIFDADPNTILLAKDIAGAIGRHIETLRRWRAEDIRAGEHGHRAPVPLNLPGKVIRFRAAQV